MWTVFVCDVYSNNSTEVTEVESRIQQDSLEDQLSKLVRLFDASKIDSAYTFATQLKHAAEDLNYPKIKVSAQLYLAKIYNRWDQYHRSDSITHLSLQEAVMDDDIKFSFYIVSYNNSIRQNKGKKAKMILDQAKDYIGDPKGNNMVRYRYCLADYYTSLNENNKVLEQLLLAKRDAPSDTGPRELFNINYQLGALYKSIGVLDQAIMVGIENEKLAKEHIKPYYELFAIYTQLDAYAEMQDHDTVKSLVKKAIHLKDNYNVSAAFGWVYYIQGMSYLQQEQLDSALQYFDIGELISKELNTDKELSQNLAGKSQVYLKQGKLKLAREYAEESTKLNEQELEEDLAKIFIGLDAAEGNYSMAYEKSNHLIENLTAKGSSNENYKIISTLLSDKFNTEKELEINELKENENKLHRNLILGVLSSLIAILIGYLMIQHKNQQQLENLNQTLVKRNEALTNFSYISSHDLKEPVRNIISFSELLEQSLLAKKSSSQDLKFTSIIKNSSKTLHEIVRSLKIFSETAFDEEIKLENFDVRKVFADLESNIQLLVTEKNAKLSFNNPHDLSVISFSRPMFYLLVQNLVQNALKYNSKEHPEVEVTIKIQLNDYIISVLDNGDGIAQNQLDYIFKPFRTLQSKSLTQSSGLGLSICKNILDKFGGKIWVESELYKGSSFYFKIPRNLKTNKAKTQSLE